ncbi:UNVERIFIED_CONTAM: hypothetical protein FKN15_056955 [Acipenser sinensis]
MEDEPKHSIFDRIPAAVCQCPPPGFFWLHPASAPAVSRSLDSLYKEHDADKLGLAQFLPVEASIASLVQMPNLALLQRDVSCPNKQCSITEVMLKKAYVASAICMRLGSYSSILVAYQSMLLQSMSSDHRPLSLQLDELSLVNNRLLQLSEYNGQALGRSMAALVAVRKQLWLAQFRVPDKDKAHM